MFKGYKTERKSAIWRASGGKKKNLEKSSIHVDLNMSFFFVYFFSKDRQTCVFYAIVSYT